jgi:hypothetical protein
MTTLSKSRAVSSLTAGPEGLEYAVGVGLGVGFGVSALLLKPMLKADREADGGGSLLGGCAGAVSSARVLVLRGGCGGGRSSSSVKSFLLGLEGIRGLGGIFGTRSRSTIGGALRLDIDLAVERGGLLPLAFSSNSRRVGGNGGSFARSRGGGNFLCDSTDEELVDEDAVCPRDSPETVELNDVVESFDPLLAHCVDAFRGGRAGDG